MTEYKIYKIVSPHTDKIYIGTTKKTLTERLNGHKSNYKKWLKDNNYNYITSFEILKFNDYVIELIESRVYIDKLERNEKEGHYIKLNKSICVNKNIPARTKEELRYSKLQYQLQYQQTHTEQLKKHQIQYKEKYREQIKEYNKQYYQNTLCICEMCICEICNVKYRPSGKYQHDKTIMHVNIIKLISV